MIAVLIAIESTRGTLISATLAVGEKSCRRAFSSARASRLHSQLLLWNVSTTNATEYFVAISEVSGVPCSPPRAHGGLPARMRQSRPTLKKIPTYVDATIQCIGPCVWFRIQALDTEPAPYVSKWNRNHQEPPECSAIFLENRIRGRELSIRTFLVHGRVRSSISVFFFIKVERELRKK